ncbi:hypothetical protein [Azospirillum agricola]|uniref:hypothetical protein n=1 Tax=Azospirillum agricola TaxID=1720247 RepID=UPI000A0EF26D|nr:hypothetical protein [Azospirillum agricola]MBP2228684.1 hypothetical protein [Azospirillum agricola]SMH40280.1 hypothetical protein SAMN02982994_1596 [Azospirillum lipoferum]
MQRTLAATFLAPALLTLSVLAAGPAHAQKQEYQPWTYDEMVPTGPYMRNMEQAQPVPGARPSHWGSMKQQPGQGRAGMTRYGTDVKSTTRSYSATQSLTPPRVDPSRPILAAPPRSADPPATPRTARRD